MFRFHGNNFNELGSTIDEWYMQVQGRKYDLLRMCGTGNTRI